MKKYDLKMNVLIFILVVFFIALNTWVYISGEKTIYVWDFRNYWNQWQNYGNLITKNFFRWFVNNEHEIRNADYNPSSISFLFPFYLILGPGRFAYISGLTMVYLSLLGFLISLFLKQLYDNSQRVFIFTLILATLFVPFWRPTLRGYPDIIGLLPLLGSVLLVINASFSVNFSVRKSLWLGFLLWAAFLFRRWYAYTIVSLYITLPVLVFFYDRLKTKNVAGIKVLTQVRNIALTFTTSAITTVLFSYAFQSGLIKRIIRTDYSVAYSAYQAPFLVSLKNTLTGIGYYILPVVLLSILYALIFPYRKKSLISLFALANLVISFFLFTRTQSPGIQHMLPFAMWIFIITMIGLNDLIVFLNKKGPIIAGVIVVLSVFILINNLYRTGPKIPTAINAILPDKNYSLKLDNIDHYQELVDVLTSLTRNGDQFAVLSSSFTLSGDQLDSLSQGVLSKTIFYISEMDLRDKLRIKPFTVKYLVVADPVQLLRYDKGQKVVQLPALALLNHQGIGNAYKKLPYDFILANNVHAYIYEKMRAFTPEEIDGLFNQFIAIYPDWRDELYAGLGYEYLTAEASLGDTWGRFDFIDAQTLTGHPGANRPTVIKFHWRPDHLVIRSVSKTCPDADGVVVTLDDAAGQAQTAKIPNGGSHAFEIKNFKRDAIRMTLDKGLNIDCDLVTITKE